MTPFCMFGEWKPLSLAPLGEPAYAILENQHDRSRRVSTYYRDKMSRPAAVWPA
jgi:hypothetical protein